MRSGSHAVITCIFSVGMCVLTGTLGSNLATMVHAAGQGEHQIRGRVEAVNTSDSVPVIVVINRRGTNGEVVVGAVIKPGISIVRGRKSIKFEAIRVGEEVTLTYVKTRYGLLARSIIVHSK